VDGRAVSFINSRLRRIESAARRSYRCPECGHLPDGPGYSVLMNEARPEESFKGDPDERCVRCGRHLYFVIRVVHDSPDDAEGGGGKL
jgi:ribosomal protein S14